MLSPPVSVPASGAITTSIYEVEVAAPRVGLEGGL